MFVRGKNLFTASKLAVQGFDLFSPKTFPKLGLRTVSATSPLTATLTRLTPQEVRIAGVLFPS